MSTTPHEHVCPACGEELKYLTACRRDEPPVEGDFSVCLLCLETSQFDAAGQLVPCHDEVPEHVAAAVAIMRGEA